MVKFFKFFTWFFRIYLLLMKSSLTVRCYRLSVSHNPEKYRQRLSILEPAHQTAQSEFEQDAPAALALFKRYSIDVPELLKPN